MEKRNTKESDKKILYLTAIVSLLFFFLILQNVYQEGKLTILDKKINDSVQKIQSPAFIFISKVISNIFEPIIFLILFLLVALYLLHKKRKGEAFFLAVFTIFSFFISQLIKISVHRPRPINSLIMDGTYSFPSGHALMSVIFFGILIYLFEHHITKRKDKFILTFLSSLLVLVISLTRLYLNVHWFTDVLASLFLGVLLIISYIFILPSTGIFKKE